MTQKKTIKLGNVPFLNAKPLVFPLEKELIEHEFEIIATPPSILSEMLHEGSIDLGLIPTAELLRRNKYSVVPDISISSYGKVDSVTLLTRTEMRDIKTVSVDNRSQSSTALLKIVLEIFNGIYPRYLKRNVGAGFLDGVDSGMVIGDLGLKFMHYPPDGYEVYDLGEIWTEETGLPFVYAVFAVNEGVRLGKNLEALHLSKSAGLNLVEKIAKIESERLGLSERNCVEYLTERIRYDLGERERAGIVKYSEFLSDLGMSERIRDLSLYFG